MSAIPAVLLRHTITVEPYLGDTATGPTYGPPAEVRAFVDERTRQLRGPDGRQVISWATCYCPPGIVAPAGSRITLADGRTATVMTRQARDGGGLPVPDHVEIQLQ